MPDASAPSYDVCMPLWVLTDSAALFDLLLSPPPLPPPLCPTDNLLLQHELLTPALVAQLSVLADSSATTLARLSPATLVAQFLPRLLPEAWRSADGPVQWQQQQQPDAVGSSFDSAATGADDCGADARLVSSNSSSSSIAVTWEWLQALWQWLATRRTELRALQGCGWPVLPVLHGRLVELRQLPESPVVAHGGDGWPPGLERVLGMLGVTVLDSESFELPLDALLQNCVHRPGAPGVAAAACAALGLHATADASSSSSSNTIPMPQLSLADARLLRAFLLRAHWFDAAKPGSSEHSSLLLLARRLPMYERANTTRAAPDASAAALVPLEPDCALAPAGAELTIATTHGALQQHVAHTHAPQYAPDAAQSLQVALTAP